MPDPNDSLSAGASMTLWFDYNSMAHTMFCMTRDRSGRWYSSMVMFGTDCDRSRVD